MVDKIWYNMEELVGGSEERVLIETYWNVKHILLHCCHPRPRINRNILECKVLPDNQRLHQESRINRNILECKGGVVLDSDCCTIVLIETYWNVKNRELIVTS